MKQVSEALSVHLSNSQTFVSCDLYELMLAMAETHTRAMGQLLCVRRFLQLVLLALIS